ncbi:Hsp20 family protein, partial [Candidatus Saccharibacteria bacterium]|nr:Hsp20 family protein [Candidatus Saccharibacteria bacterium]
MKFMAIVRWDPHSLRPFFRWPRWMEDWEWPEPAARGLRIHETNKNIIAEAVVAGVPADKVEVNIEDGVLTVKAEAEEKEEKKKAKKYAAYRYYYTAALSGGGWAKAKAEIEDGVLTVTIPKAVA